MDWIFKFQGLKTNTGKYNVSLSVLKKIFPTCTYEHAML